MSSRDRICCRHLYGRDRVLVAFQDEEVWVLLVGRPRLTTDDVVALADASTRLVRRR